MSSCVKCNEATLDRGLYIDPSVYVLPKIRCESCGKVLSRKLTKQIKDTTKTMTLEEAFNKLGVRACCRASMLSDEVVSGARTEFNPEREAGIITDVEARQQTLSPEENVQKTWHGHMKRTNLRIQREGNSYHAVNPETEDLETTYLAPEGEEVAEWLEVSVPTFAAKAFAKPTKRILVPRLVSKQATYRRVGAARQEELESMTDPEFEKFK